MKTKKRKKTSRIRGARTCGWGFRQKHKGHGNSGGQGFAGSGKRADHKKQKILESVKGAYFGKQGATSRRTAKKKEKTINLREVQERFSEAEIKLEKFKILGQGEGFKSKIIAKAASKSAIEKMKSAGGEIVLPSPKVREKVEKGKEEEKVVEKKNSGK